MRSLPIVALLALTGCSALPGLEHPQVTFEGQYALLEVNGNSSLQSPGSGSSVQNNSRIGLEHFGLGDRDEEYGGTLSLGDGFSGLDLIYLNMDVRTSRVGTLPDDWGALQAGDVAHPSFHMDEFRLRYTAQLYEWESEDELKIQAGASATLAHREIDFDVVGYDAALNRHSQNIDIKDDGVPYLGGRVRASYDRFGGQVDYAISPDLPFAGDFNGVLQDLELIGTFTIPDQDLTLYAGWRHSELPASGRAGNLHYDTDLTLEGFVFGLKFLF